MCIQSLILFVRAATLSYGGSCDFSCEQVSSFIIEPINMVELLRQKNCSIIIEPICMVELLRPKNCCLRAPGVRCAKRAYGGLRARSVATVNDTALETVDGA